MTNMIAQYSTRINDCDDHRSDCVYSLIVPKVGTSLQIAYKLTSDESTYTMVLVYLEVKSCPDDFQ